jgi:3',5'-cyclic AMP phosphodiesterase CpdA
MRDWLIEDLSANTRSWTVVIFHHPPYTKGASHDSDDVQESQFDRPEWDARTQFTPIFEQYGVDVVYSGHSHSYERSYYLRGHTGTSDTFSVATHAELNANKDGALGKGADGPYYQRSKTSGGVDDRVVYTVAGSSSKYDKNSAAFTPPEEWMRHPAHIPQANDPQGRRGMPVLGSVVLDAFDKTLISRFIDTEGKVLDEFVIKR